MMMSATLKNIDKLETTKHDRFESVEHRNILAATTGFRNDFLHSLHEVEK